MKIQKAGPPLRPDVKLGFTLWGDLRSTQTREGPGTRGSHPSVLASNSAARPRPRDGKRVLGEGTGKTLRGPGLTESQRLSGTCTPTSGHLPGHRAAAAPSTTPPPTGISLLRCVWRGDFPAQKQHDRRRGRSGPRAGTHWQPAGQSCWGLGITLPAAANHPPGGSGTIKRTTSQNAST